MPARSATVTTAVSLRTGFLGKMAYMHFAIWIGGIANICFYWRYALIRDAPRSTQSCPSWHFLATTIATLVMLFYCNVNS